MYLFSLHSAHYVTFTSLLRYVNIHRLSRLLSSDPLCPPVCTFLIRKKKRLKINTAFSWIIHGWVAYVKYVLKAYIRFVLYTNQLEARSLGGGGEIGAWDFFGVFWRLYYLRVHRFISLSLLLFVLDVRRVGKSLFYFEVFRRSHATNCLAQLRGEMSEVRGLFLVKRTRSLSDLFLLYNDYKFFFHYILFETYIWL